MQTDLIRSNIFGKQSARLRGRDSSGIKLNCKQLNLEGFHIWTGNSFNGKKVLKMLDRKRGKQINVYIIFKSIQSACSKENFKINHITFKKILFLKFQKIQMKCCANKKSQRFKKEGYILKRLIKFIQIHLFYKNYLRVS